MSTQTLSKSLEEKHTTYAISEKALAETAHCIQPPFMDLLHNLYECIAYYVYV